MTSLLASPSVLEPAASEFVPVRVAVLGYGYWGPNLARNVATAAETRLVAIADLNPKRLAAARAAHPLAVLTQDFREVLVDPSIEAVVVATPPETHYELVRAALEAGKHVLVEKPLTTNVMEAQELVALAAESGLTLAVDHTFLFTGAVKRMKRYFEDGEVGDVYYYDSTRINLGLFQNHTNVVWDLAPHDISIMLHLLEKPVRRVSAFGARHVDTAVENIAYLTLQFDDELLAHFHVNWLAPAKVRRTIIGGSKKMLVYDDVEASEKLKVYDSGAHLCASQEDVYKKLVEYRTGDVLAPQLEKTEALAAETSHFARVVRGLETTISGGELGVSVVRVVEAAQESLRRNGIPVEVER
ncbi:MAG: Gfo/Idh/MocA family protein [Hyphomicrobiales bacterium]